MTTTEETDWSNSRRRFLALAGAAAATAVAGCTGSADEPDGGAGDSPGDGSGNGGAGSGGGGGSCGDIRGTPTAFDPGDREFPLLFEHPDTFEEYNEDLNETENAIGAQLGHAPSAETNSYPVNIVTYQHTRASTDEEANQRWLTMFGNAERIDWSFTHGGERIDVYENTAFDDPKSAAWRFMIPAHETEGRRGVTVQFQDDRDEQTCMDELTAAAQALIVSLTPNSAWTGSS